MKKILFSVAFLAFIVSDSYADVTIKKVNGGRNGYGSVVEYHGDGFSTLDCIDKGRAICEFQIDPIMNLNTKLAISIAEDNIKTGNTEGSTFYNGHLIKWSGFDIYNYELNINDSSGDTEW